MLYKADFHIHSCLSPCGSLEMSPLRIVREALHAGLSVIALADHNSAKNCPAFSIHCEREGIECLVGMEVSTREEAHVLCLFDSLDAVMELDRIVYEHLPNVCNQPERFGDQVYVNVDDEIEGKVDKYLISAADIPMVQLEELVHERDGLFIPSHVNRDSFSISSQLGFIPPGNFDAVEVTPHYDWRRDPLQLRGNYAILTDSDAHQPEQIGRIWNDLELPEWSIDALKSVLIKNLALCDRRWIS